MPPNTGAPIVPDFENPNDGHYQKLDGTEESSSPNDFHYEKVPPQTPWYIMPILVTAITLGSAAGPIMKKMETDGAAPLAVGSWRHQVTSMTLFPFALWQWCKMKPEDRSGVLTRTNAVTILICAFGLAGHFSFWIWSLDNTLLTHSLLLCIMSPLFITLFTFLRHGKVLCGEVMGVVLGVVGSVILAAGAEVEKDVEFTVLGDLAALTGSCCFAIYLLGGKDLRGKLPLFVYLWPVNVMATIYFAVTLTVFGEMGALTNYNDVGFFAWMSKEYVVRTLVLGMGTGFLCHVGYNLSMGYIKPLILSVGFSVSPLVGSFVGWAMGETGIPGLLTMFGGLVTMVATVWVSHASSQEAKAKIQSEEKQPLIINDEA